MDLSLKWGDFSPLISPQDMSGEIKHRIIIRTDKARADGTNTIYLYLYHKKRRKKINLNISVPLRYFDKKKQRIKSNYIHARDYNLLLDKVMADVNKIMVNYRLSGSALSLDQLYQDLTQPSLRADFITFSKNLLEYQLANNVLKKSTYRQQKSSIRKFKKFQERILFADIDMDLLIRLKSWMIKDQENSKTTINSTLKNLKKFIKAANDQGIHTELKYSDISVGSMQGEIMFLMPQEIKSLLEYRNSSFINTTYKNILSRFLFACFTGLRISDIKKINEDNFLDDSLVFTSQKTSKFQRIRLNKTALSLVVFPEIFEGKYTEPFINRELKKIVRACGINKNIHFHTSRHTFATNYLMAGGQIQNLQKLLGHSSITTTMVYSHAVESITNKEIIKLDDIVV